MKPFDWERIFGRRAPRVVDLGCGDGRYLISAAQARPDRDHLGIELVAPLAAKGRREAERLRLPNLRFETGDAVAWLSGALETGSVDEIHLYHPQPYFDPSQAGLGMLTPEFFARIREVLRPHGLLVVQTDSPRCGKYLLEALPRHFDPEIRDGRWPDAPQGRTSRERLAIRKKLTILRIEARRRASPRDVPVPPPYYEEGRPGLRTIRAAKMGRPRKSP